MTTIRHIRTSAGRLESVEETIDDSVIIFSVDERPFAWVDQAESTLRIAVPSREADSIIDDIPSARRVRRPVGVAVALTEVNGMVANSLMHRAWAHARPSGAPAPATIVDVPPSIGRPATRALAEHGIGSLSDLAGHARTEIAAWHGVGPKALDILTQALSKAGLSWR